jgi:uncharacterized protein YqcC (DUF446 family)
MNEYTRLADIILSLELSMREQSLWDETPPSAKAMASSQPFSVDTLTFPQWLQFVFICRVKGIIEQQDSLPTSSEIVPMAEEYLTRADVDGKHILRSLRAFDQLIND